jgi:hypothetical protein
MDVNGICIENNENDNNNNNCNTKNPTSDLEYPCGNECVYNKTSETDGKCQYICYGNYIDVNGICVQNDDLNSETKTLNNIIWIIVLIIISVICFVLVIVIIIIYFKKRKIKNNNSTIFYDNDINNKKYNKNIELSNIKERKEDLEFKSEFNSLMNDDFDSENSSSYTDSDRDRDRDSDTDSYTDTDTDTDSDTDSNSDKKKFNKLTFGNRKSSVKKNEKEKEEDDVKFEEVGGIKESGEFNIIVDNLDDNVNTSNLNFDENFEEEPHVSFAKKNKTRKK